MNHNKTELDSSLVVPEINHSLSSSLDVVENFENFEIKKNVYLESPYVLLHPRKFTKRNYLFNWNIVCSPYKASFANTRPKEKALYERSKYFKLKHFSLIHNRDVYVRLSNNIVDRIDSAMCQPVVDTTLDFMLHCLCTEYNYNMERKDHKISFTSDHNNKDYLKLLVKSLRNHYLGKSRVIWNSSSFTGISLEATSLLEGGSIWGGVKHSLAAVYNFATHTPEKLEEMTRKVEDWLLEIGDLLVNLSIKKLFFTLLKLVKDYVNISSCLPYLLRLVQNTYNYLLSSMPKQPSQGISQEVEPTMWSFDDAIDLDALKCKSPAIAAVFAAVTVVFANIICVKNLVDNKSNDNLTTKVAKAFHLSNLGQNAFTSIIKNIIGFSKAVYQAVFDMLLGDKSSAIFKLVQECPVTETELCKKNMLFNYLEFLEHPANLYAIHTNEAYKSQLEFCHKIFENIQLLLTTQDYHDISNQVRDYVKARISSLNVIRNHVYKRPTVEPMRFTPYWLNILGKPGTGKSVAVPLISNYVKKVLSEMPEDFELTSEDRWLFPVNFSDEYLTHYNGHYMVTCDDFLQDTPGTLTQSSALKVITWISCIPSFTVQAALADKGTPFTSKIFISTSNDKAMNRTTEINSTEALTRRMNLCVELFEDPTRENIDPLIGAPGKKISIRQLNKEDRNQVFKVYKDSLEFLEEFTTDYIKWYRHQKEVIKSRIPQQAIITQLAKKVMNRCQIPDPEIVNTLIKRLEATQSMWCKVGFTPSMKEEKIIKFNDLYYSNDEKIKVYDCDCELHKQLNGDYIKYLQSCTMAVDYHTVSEFNNYQPCGLTRTFKDQYVKLYETVTKAVEKIWEQPLARFLSYALCTVALVYGGYHLAMAPKNSLSAMEMAITAKNLKSTFEPSAAQYSQRVVRSKNVKAKITKPGVRRIEATEGEIEAMLSQTISKQSYDLAYNNIIKNGSICQLYFVDGLQRTHINTGLRIAGRAILSNHHFFNQMKEGDVFVVKYFNQATGFQQIQQQFTKDSMHRIDDTDVIVYNCSKSLPQSKDITKHFQKSDSINIVNQEALIVTRHPANSTPVVMMNVTVKPNVHTISYSTGEEEYAVLDSYVSNCPVEKGMSGSVLVSTDARMVQKILGIQTCRDTQTLCGYFQPISCDQLVEALEALEVDSFEFQGGEVEITKVIVDSRLPPNIEEGGALTYIGSVPKTMRIKGQTNTKLEKSLIHDESIVTQQPSVLSDYDERMNDDLIGKSVIFRAIEGFNSAKGVIDIPVLRRSVRELKEEYNVTLTCKGISRRLLTDNEMINGIPGLINRVEMKSSPGYPLVLQRKDTCRGGKFEWFDEITPLPGYGKTYVMKEELADGLKQHEQALLNGIKPPVIAYACLKDETRSLAKIESGSTRAFVCLPLNYNLLIRKYFGAFVACQHQKAGVITSSVGINPATQWKQLYDKLSEKNNLWEDFDYKNWDQHLPPDFVLSVADIVNKWYGDSMDTEAGRLRYMLLYDLVFTYIIVKDRMFQKSTGQCSGCAITAELNCLVHDILMYYVWLKVCKDKEIDTSLYEYRDAVACIMYGDDIVMSVRPSYKEIFNGNIIKPYMDKLGMLITPGDKVSTTFVPKQAKDILFLKRSFIKDGDFVKAPLRSDIVENIPQWIHKSDNPIEATRVNCETALRESYMHGKKYFSEVLSNLNERIKSINLETTKFQLPPVVMDYQTLDEKYRNSEFICAGLDGPQNMKEELW